MYTGCYKNNTIILHFVKFACCYTYTANLLLFHSNINRDVYRRNSKVIQKKTKLFERD